MTDDLRTGMARAICRTGRIETGQGTCSLFCMDQLGDPRKSGCWHVERVHGAIADAAIAHFNAHLASDAMVERVARIIAPSRWAVMDSYLLDAKRKYKGQNVGWPTEQFQDSQSMVIARAVIAAQVAAMKGSTP